MPDGPAVEEDTFEAAPVEKPQVPLAADGGDGSPLVVANGCSGCLPGGSRRRDIRVEVLHAKNLWIGASRGCDSIDVEAGDLRETPDAHSGQPPFGLDAGIMT